MADTQILRLYLRDYSILGYKWFNFKVNVMMFDLPV